jgi:predicted MFS family arabinose efflux permease
VLRVAIGWSLVMLAHFVVLTYIDAYLQHLGAPAQLTSVALVIIGAGSIIGTLLVGRVASRSVSAALLFAPITVAAGFVVLFVAGTNLIAALAGVALWGIGLSAAVVVYQQAILLTGARAPESATSIGVLLASRVSRPGRPSEDSASTPSASGPSPWSPSRSYSDRSPSQQHCAP